MRSIRLPVLLFATTLAAGCSPDAPSALSPEAGQFSMGAAHCENVRFGGDFLSTGGFPLVAIGEVSGDLSGTGYVTFLDGEQRGQGALHWQMTTSFDFGNGNTLTTTEATVITPSNRINERVTITGGTGIYEGAWGHFNTRGTVNLAAAPGEVIASITWQGRICTP